MAGDPQIRGFNADVVRKGLHLAMQVGLPPETENRPTFFMPRTETATEEVDGEGVPFDPSYRPAFSVRRSVQVKCAIQYVDGEGKLEGFGVIAPTKVVITLLDVDYAKVKGFEFVVLNGIRFFYRRTENEKGLVTIGLYKVHCASEDEG